MQHLAGSACPDPTQEALEAVGSVVEAAEPRGVAWTKNRRAQRDAKHREALGDTLPS